MWSSTAARSALGANGIGCCQVDAEVAHHARSELRSADYLVSVKLTTFPSRSR